MRTTILLILFLLCALPMQAQNEINRYRDPENNILSARGKADSDTAAITRFFNLYYQNREKDPSKALLYLQQGLTISQAIGNQEKTALLNYHKGYLFRMLGINNLALTSDLQALAYYEKSKDASLTGWVLIDIGNIYFDENLNLNMALDHFQKAEKIFQKIDNKVGVIVATYCIGLVHKDNAAYSKAIKYFLIAAELSRQAKEKSHEAYAYSFLGQSYLLTGAYQKAQECFHQSLRLSQSLNDKQGMAQAYSNIAGAFGAKGATKNCMLNYNAALYLLEEVHNKLEISRTLEKMSMVVKKEGQMDLAIDYACRSLAVADSNYLMNQQQKILPLLSLYYAEGNQVDKAYKMLQRYVTLKESSINTNSRQIQLAYESQLKQQEAATQKEKSNRHKTINYFLAGGLLLVGLFSYTLYAKNKELKATYHTLYQKHLALTQTEAELTEIKKQVKVRSTVNEELHNDLHSKLTAMMETEKVYLNNAISLDDLARQLNTNRTYLSQVINDKFNTNFNTYINEYRVKEAQKILLGPESKILTIEAIAQNVGFNSKSSFNTAFKKFSGLTPSDFISMKQG